MNLWPRIGVSAIIPGDGPRVGQAVLVQRGKAPYRGYWSLPGGAVEAGETLEEAVLREVVEETGLQIRVERFLRFSDLIRRGREQTVQSHYVLAVFQVRVTGGTLVAGDDADNAIWADAPAAARLRLTPGIADILEEFLL